MKFPPEHKFTKLSLLRRGPPSVLQMINKAKNIDELKKFFKEFSDRDRRRIEQKTKNQSENENWFLYRQATISGTIAKRVVTQIKRERTSIPLNSSISKFRSRGFTCPAIEYGTSNKKRVSTFSGHNLRKIIIWRKCIKWVLWWIQNSHFFAVPPI